MLDCGLGYHVTTTLTEQETRSERLCRQVNTIQTGNLWETPGATQLVSLMSVCMWRLCPLPFFKCLLLPETSYSGGQAGDM